MSERKGRLDEARRWARQAQADLERIDYNFRGGYYDLVAFLSQQAAEKALKALQECGIYQVGRYARWVFQGIADSIKEGVIASI